MKWHQFLFPQTELWQNVPEGLEAAAAFTVYIEKAIIHFSLKALRNFTCLAGNLFAISLVCLIFNFQLTLCFSCESLISHYQYWCCEWVKRAGTAGTHVNLWGWQQQAQRFRPGVIRVLPIKLITVILCRNKALILTWLHALLNIITYTNSALTLQNCCCIKCSKLRLSESVCVCGVAFFWALKCTHVQALWERRFNDGCFLREKDCYAKHPLIV